MIGKEKKPDLIFIVIYLFLFGIGLLMTIHVSNEYVTLQASIEEEVSIYNYMDILNNGLSSFEESPFNVEIDKQAMKASAFYIFCVVIGVAYVKTSKKKTLWGQEQGSAEWASIKEEKQYADKDFYKNMIFTNSVFMSIDTRKTRKNNNVLVIGGSGTGKSRFVVKPNIMQANTSFVITDPSGDLLESTGHLLEKQGYDIKIFNLIEMENSDKYNPFAYIRSEEEVTRVVDCILKNTKSDKKQSGGDPFWDDSIKALLSALFYYLWLEAPKEQQNLKMVMQLIRMAEVKEDDSEFESDLDIMFRLLEEQYKDKDEVFSEDGIKYVENGEHIAVKQYKVFKLAGAKTASSILVSLAVRLSAFNLSKVADLTNEDTINLSTIGDKKTALFVIIPDGNTTFNFLVAILYTQLFETLYYQADFGFNSVTGEKNGGRLKYHVRFIMDEMANTGQIPDLEIKIATMRRREISVTLILQNLAQIKNLYEKTWEIITGNCDSFLFLGGQEQSTLEYVSKKLGKATIDKRSTSRTRGKQGSSSQSWDILGRELMTPDEVAKMKDSDCILFIRGNKPYFSKKFIIEKHERYKETSDFNSDNSYDFRSKFIENTEENNEDIKNKKIDLEKKQESKKRENATEIIEDIENKKINLEKKEKVNLEEKKEIKTLMTEVSKDIEVKDVDIEAIKEKVSLEEEKKIKTLIEDVSKDIEVKDTNNVHREQELIDEVTDLIKEVNKNIQVKNVDNEMLKESILDVHREQEINNEVTNEEIKKMVDESIKEVKIGNEVDEVFSIFNEAYKVENEMNLDTDNEKVESLLSDLESGIDGLKKKYDDI